MKKIRFGLVGFGAWGRHHAQVIARTEGAELVAVAAASEESRAAARAAHPGCETTADYRALVARPDLDAVDVVLPSHLHYEVGRAVLDSGKHLLLEKPMALNVADCRRLSALARRRRRLLAVGFEMRLSTLWGTMREMIREGAVGEPRYAVIDLWRRPYRRGSRNWRYDPARVGSWILEEPIHFFDLARWIFGQVGEPVSVVASANSIQRGRPELHDNFSAFVRFPGEAYAVITQTLAAFEHHQEVKVTGTRGALRARWDGTMDRDRRPSFSLVHYDGRKVRDVRLSAPSGEVHELAEEVGAFVRVLQGRERPRVATGVDGAWAVKLCLAARDSVARQRPVSLADFSPGGSRGQTRRRKS